MTGDSPPACGDACADAAARGPAEAPPLATILLCTFNGERFLAEQLASLEAQTFTRWKLAASDDGSTDDTGSILQAFERSHGTGKVEIVDGPRRGAAANFLFLACRQSPVTSYYAFCDQDDIWEPDKLARAIAVLNQVPPGIPALYASRTRLIDARGKHIGLSPLRTRAPAFRSALVQSIAGGNTMVFNRHARNLLVLGGPDIDIPAHDWWLYQATSACGGFVHYDARPSVRYRQHAGNVIGANTGIRAQLRRFMMVWRGRLRYWSDLNITALTRLRPHMNADNLQVLDLFSTARHQTLLPRTLMFAKSGVYRHTLLGNLGLAMAVIFKKI